MSTVQCPVTFSILVQRLEILISVSEDLNRGTVHCPAESRPSSCTQVYSYTQLNDTEQSLLHNCDVEPGKFGANLDQSLLVGAHLHLVCGMLINPTTLHLILKAPISWLKLSLRRLMLSFSYRLGKPSIKKKHFIIDICLYFIKGGVTPLTGPPNLYVNN